MRLLHCLVGWYGRGPVSIGSHSNERSAVAGVTAQIVARRSSARLSFTTSFANERSRSEKSLRSGSPPTLSGSLPFAEAG